MDQTSLHAAMLHCRYGVVSSIGEDGVPQSALVGIAIGPQLEIIFETLKSSRKYPNLVKRPECAFVLICEGEQTIQFEGIAFEPTGVELEEYQSTYFAVRPDGPSRMNWPGIAYLVVRPRWIRYSDYDQQPPLIKENSFRLSVTTDERRPRSQPPR